MRGIILAIIYLVELCKYQLGYFLLFPGKLSKKWILLVGGVPFLAAAFFNQLGEDGIYILMYLNVIAVMALVMQGRPLIRLMRLFILCFMLSCMDEVFEICLSFYEPGQVGAILPGDFQYLIASLMTCGILLLALFIKSRLNREHYKRFLFLARKGMQPLVAVMALFMLFTVAGLSYAKDQIANKSFHIFVNWVSIVSLLGTGILGMFAIYIWDVNHKMQEMVRKELALQDMQKRYYEALLEKEEDTRKYRHDMSNHLLCLNALVEEEDISGVKEYLMKMRGQMEQIQKSCYVTGNKILDVICNYYLPLLDEEVSVCVSGKLHSDLSIDEMELCTIYANLIQNAVEEIKRQEKDSGRFLEIRIWQGKTYFQTEIKNSVSENCQEEALLSTSKADKRNHGIGLKNVEKVVKDHGGRLEIEKNSVCFTVKVTLKNAEITV